MEYYYLSPTDYTDYTDFIDFLPSGFKSRSFATQKSLYGLHGCHAAFYIELSLFCLLDANANKKLHILDIFFLQRYEKCGLKDVLLLRNSE